MDRPNNGDKVSEQGGGKCYDGGPFGCRGAFCTAYDPIILGCGMTGTNKTHEVKHAQSIASALHSLLLSQKPFTVGDVVRKANNSFMVEHEARSEMTGILRQLKSFSLCKDVMVYQKIRFKGLPKYIDETDEAEKLLCETLSIAEMDGLTEAERAKRLLNRLLG